MIAKRILVEYLEMKKKIVEGKDGIGLDGFDGDEGRRKRHGEIIIVATHKQKQSQCELI
jgi:hypothetical protein